MNLWHKEKLQEVSKATQRRRINTWLDGLVVKHFPDANGWPVADGDVKDWRCVFSAIGDA
jgi:hypothetical protein